MPIGANKPATRAVASIDLVASVRCCSWSGEVSPATLQIAADAGGGSLGKLVCDACGSEYEIGVLARTREASLASEAFEHVAEDELEQLGVDRSDYEPSADEPAMCVSCDGGVDRKADWCSGCKEFVCARCRKYRGIDPRRHQAHAHYEPPKQRAASSEDSDVDGFEFGDDFAAEDEL